MKALDPELDFDKMYDLYGTSLYRFCFSLMGNRSEAEDLVQEVFIAAIKGRERFQRRSSVRTWLYRIAYYRSRELKSKRNRETGMRDDLHAPLSTSDARLVLEQALDGLSIRLREAFTLVKIEQFTCQESARILGIPEGTVKYHVYQAIQELRCALSETDPRPEEETPHAV
jgi:RNA polymerase sigma-70 factor (ECF subfamily)